jgi:cellulose synthase/poly-beta-1,6-N-acetylglucosamine synthase-like glycosyltransferase
VTEVLFWACAFLSVYPYTIYPGSIWLISLLKRETGGGVRNLAATTLGFDPPFSHVVAAHSEEDLIREKIEESLSALAGSNDCELVVVSDYSTDRTLEAAKNVESIQLVVAASTGPRGKAGANNEAVRLAKNAILVFSDVETRIPRESLSRLIAAFQDPCVGCAVAEIAFSNEHRDDVSAAAGLYWRFEMWLRSVESRAGLYATGSGPCMAVRRSAFKPLPPSGDVDFTTPLDVVDQGYRCVHVSGAYAFDSMPRDDRAEFRARVRMVAKNFGGTICRWGARNLIRRPLYSWAIYSHKIMRWLAPFFMLVTLVSTLLLLRQGWVYRVSMYLELAILLAACTGWYAYRRKTGWPIVGQVYAFLLANVAFALGVLKVIAGQVPTFYTPTRQTSR